MKLNALLQIEQQPAQGLGSESGPGSGSGLLLAAVRNYVSSFLSNGVYVNALIHGNLPSSGAATLATSIRTSMEGFLTRNKPTNDRAMSVTSGGGLTNTACQHIGVLALPSGPSHRKHVASDHTLADTVV